MAILKNSITIFENYASIRQLYFICWIEYQSLIIDNCPIRLSLLNFNNLKIYRAQKCMMLVLNAHIFFLLNLICYVFSSENVSSTKYPYAQNNSTFNSAERNSEKYVSKDDTLSAYIDTQNFVKFDMIQIVWKSNYLPTTFSWFASMVIVFQKIMENMTYQENLAIERQ